MKACLIMLLCFFSTAYAESSSPVVDGSVYPAGEGDTGTGVVKPAPPNALYEMMVRLDQLQAEVQHLTGKLEEQENLIAELKKSQTTMYSDLDGRIQVVEKKMEGGKPSTVENAPVQDGSAGTEARQSDAQAANPAVAPAVKQVPPQKQNAAQPTVSGDEKQQYQKAYEAFRNGHTAQAIAEFNALLAKNPKGEYANDAQFWLGEAYRVNQDADSARKAFNSLLANSPGSPKVPDALLKLGDIEVEQKNNAKAREYLTRVTVDFPGSKAAHLAAKKLLLIDDVK